MRTVLYFVLICLISFCARADDVYLRNGQVLKNCIVIDTMDSHVHLHTTQRDRIIPLSSIDKIVLVPFDLAKPTVVINADGSVQLANSRDSLKTDVTEKISKSEQQKVMKEDSLINNAFGINLVGGITINAGGFTAGTNVFILRKRSIYSMRFMYSGRATNGTPESDYLTNEDYGNPFVDVSVLFGYNRKTISMLYSVSAGIGYVQGIECWNIIGHDTLFEGKFSLIGPNTRTGIISITPIYAPMNFSSVGLAFDLQVVWTYSEYYDIGLYVWGNLNHKRSFAGITVCCQFWSIW